MSKKDLTDLPVEVVVTRAHEMSPAELEKLAGDMSSEQIAALLVWLNNGEELLWQEKSEALIRGLNERSALESAGKALSLQQMLYLLLTLLKIDSPHHWKLSPLFVGFPHVLFEQLIMTATKPQLFVLKHEGITESIQHHLTMFAHRLNQDVESLIRQLEILEQEINNLDITELSMNELSSSIAKIEKYNIDLNTIFLHVNKALELAWNTPRPDLIEDFNRIKDSCHRYKVYLIGTPVKENAPATGLYAKIENHLNTVYGNPNDPNDHEALRDDEPALEALAKLKIWYLLDYWELGLLPQVKSMEELEQHLQNLSEQERVSYREKLFNEARKNLEKAGFTTVKDLKRSFIFSKKTLKEHIDKNPR